MTAWSLALAIVALILAAIALTLVALLWRRLATSPRPPFASDAPSPDLTSTAAGPPAIVVNPTKLDDPESFRGTCARIAEQCNLPAPLFFETTEDDPGESQAREAIARGASVVIAAGGDGTVRNVARALAGSGVPLGLVPMGTGNLLVRNLEIPLGSVSDQITAAFTGITRPMDVGWLKMSGLAPREKAETGESVKFADTVEGGEPLPEQDPDREYLFLVIAGIGFDAAMVAGADDQLKAKIGWHAYSVAAVKHLVGRRIAARMWVGEQQRPEQFNARTVLIANCGRLPGGVVLLPDAQLDDGWLDIAAIDTTGGPIGWAAVGGKVLLQGIGIRREPATNLPGRMTFRRGKSVRVRTERPEAVQVDGDFVGVASELVARVEHGALLVRT